MKSFWEYKSKKYPKPFDKNVLDETLKIINEIETLGVDFEDKRILDIGCGTGIYGLVFAKIKKARKVVCLDFSQGMIEKLKEEMSSYDIKNVDVVLENFADFSTEKYYKGFDISFASMTPAVTNEDDVLKMELLSNEWCIYIGWVEKKEKNIFDELYEFLGINYQPPKGFYQIKDILEKLGRIYKSSIIETSWQWSGNYEDVIEEISIRNKDVNIDKNLVKDFIYKRFPDGKVNTTIRAVEGILVWKV